MSSDLTPYTGNIFLRWLNNQADMPSRPTGLWLALFNGKPKASGTEIGATVNASTPRQPITFAALASGAAHLLTSNIAVDWGNAAGDATGTHFGLFDSATPGSGHCYASRPLSGGSQLIKSGASVKFSSGAITFNVGSDS